MKTVCKSRRRLLSSLVAWSLVVVTGSGCHLFQKGMHAQWEEAEVACQSERILFEVCASAAERAGYPLGAGTDPGRVEIQTAWKTSLSAWKGRGWRERAYLTFETVQGDRFLVRARVQRELNQSFRPSEAKHANWKRDEDNPAAARRVLEYVRAQLMAIEQ